ncbi:hypothetical protein BABINDRAFT_34447 [Babjeviella inositovora NRRL Y-12698]|uniref:PH domain-containing protein n=1 Tax=Babjeviella inositovora NRRL Y-12698 TaxID=984486 RepID=A0A1E3QUK1_9ASCO|nr:uncharacterized protein BABINDRAFT_34447 [Babjeviella inositovora NRRL Y-12698]ODQ80637.1 hypothetical protein BABINDRAFT_34447 [Babjeviella inositovora NRRL Y-12698]
METLDIHSKSFLTKWVTVPDDAHLSWQIQPVKRSINLSIYRKNDAVSPFDGGSFQPLLPPALSSTKNRSDSVILTSQLELTNSTRKRSSSLLAGLNNSGLTLEKNYNKLLPDELTKGSLHVAIGGTFAFVFDNSFSKTYGKKVLFSQKVVAAGVAANTASLQTVAFASLQTTTPISASATVNHRQSIMRPKNGELLQGVLSKKRRKRHQGFVKRFFILSFKYGILSYYLMKNPTNLRGNMPIKHCIISANEESREIVIDSGLEIWDLKAATREEWAVWVSAFNTVKQGAPRRPVTFAQPDTDMQAAGILTLHKQLQAIQRDATLETSIDEFAIGFAKLVDSANRKSFVISRTTSLMSQEFYDAEDYLETTQSVVVLDRPGNLDLMISDEISVVDKDADYTATYESESETESDVPVADSTAFDTDLYPLPLPPVERRTDVPECHVQPPSILTFVRKNVGKDLSSIAMPVSMNEPLTILQKYGELIEYCAMLDTALAADTLSGERILRIAAFAVSYQASLRAKERNTRKPFNPLLGETFEMVREDLGVRMVAEKVSHRPPIMAIAAESAAWQLQYAPLPSSKFWGKSAEVIAKGVLKLTVKATGEVYEWAQPTTLLKNVIAGEKYTEPASDLTVLCSLGQKAVAEFKAGGMFSGRSEDLTIGCFDARGRKMAALVLGKWTTALVLCVDGAEREIWRVGPLVKNYPKKFGFTEFAASLNEITLAELGMAPTDSRLRPDQRCYENGDAEKAEVLKAKLEGNQRVRRKQMEEQGVEHKPVFFKQVGEGDNAIWEYVTGEKSYWNRRRVGDWSDLVTLW